MVFAPLLLLVLWMGIYPSSFLTPIRGTVDRLVLQVHKAQQAAANNNVIPAQAGTHPSAVREADKWVPASAGMTT